MGKTGQSGRDKKLSIGWKGSLRREKMKRLRLLFLIILSIFMLAECGFKNSRNQDTPVVFNLGSEFNTLDPHLFTEMIAVQVDSTIYEGLLRLDKEGNYIGGVAESFREEGNRLIFKLRKNAKWSDGSKITPKDFIFAFKRVLDPNVAAQHAEMLFPVKNAAAYYEGKVTEEELGIKAINEDTLEIILESPAAYFKYILTLPISVPLKEDFYKTRKDKYAIKLEDFLFNGPYKITDLNGDEVLLEKNEHYWNHKEIKIPKIKYIVSKDFKAVDKLIENNEIDMSRVENYNLARYRNNGVLDTFLNGRVWYLDYNLNNTYLQNKKLRQAIFYAIDREKYVKEIKKDGSISSKLVISSIISGYGGKYRDSYPETNILNGSDVENAKRLYKEALKELGLSSLKLNLLSGNSDPEMLEIQFIQEELKTKLGLETEITTVPFKERLSRTRAGNYDIVLNTWSPKFDDPLSYLERWRKEDGKNTDIWSKAKYNGLVKEISKMGTSKERDRKINEAEMILIEEAVIAPIYFSVENHYRNPKIKNVLRRSITGVTDFTHAHTE